MKRSVPGRAARMARPLTTTTPSTLAAVGVLLVFVLVFAAAGARTDVTDVSAATEAKVVVTTVLFPVEFVVVNTDVREAVTHWTIMEARALCVRVLVWVAVW